MAENKLTMFGKTYNTVGSADSNLLLQTRGDLKIRWGNKFIDLIKNGKINVNTDLIFKVESKDKIIKDGIYVINSEENEEVWIRLGKTLINLTLESEYEYLSYKKTQNLSGEERSIAISNIGLIFNTYDDLVISGIKKGFAYVLESNKFFTISNNNISEYTFDTIIQDPIILNNLTFKGHTEEIIGNTQLSLSSNNSIALKIDNDKNLVIHKDDILCNKPIISDYNIQSSNYSNNNGYFIGIKDKKAIAIFDTIIIRNGITEYIQQITYYQLMNLIKRGLLIKNNKYEITDFLDIGCIKSNIYYPIIVTATSESTISQYITFKENSKWIVEYDVEYKYKEITANQLEGSNNDDSEFPPQNLEEEEEELEKEINESQNENYSILYVGKYKGRIIKMTDEFGNCSNFDFKHTILNDKYLYTIPNPKITELLRIIEDSETNRLYYDNELYNLNQLLLNATELEEIDEILSNISEIEGLVLRYLQLKSEAEEKLSNIETISEGSQYGNIKNNIIYLLEPFVDDSSLNILNFITFENCTPCNNIIENIIGFNNINCNKFNNNSIFSIINSNISGILSNNIFEIINSCILNGLLNNNNFKNISEITINGPLTNIDVLSDLSLLLYTYANNSNDTVIIQDNIFSKESIPRLNMLGRLTCELDLNGILLVKDNTISGTIMMFNNVNIPSGWAICDGTNGTPNLTGRFIRMIDTGESVGPKNNNDLVTNGVSNRQAYINKSIAHTHSYNSSATIDYSGLTIDYNGGNLINGYTEDSTVEVYRISATGTDTTYAEGAESTYMKEGLENQGLHNHEYSITLPSIEVSGDITATVTVTLDTEAEASNFVTAINVEPLAYALIFIMKL